MRYCYNCNRITAGEPLFCNSCGRSYNVKLCPRLHPNPRTAEVCSQCGSRDLSTPQPRLPLWAPILQFVLSLVPGLILGIVSASVVALFIEALVSRPEILSQLLPLGIALAVLWWLWAQIPAWFRRALYRMFRRRRGRDARDGRGQAGGGL